MIEINGAQDEGGGQVLRTSLTLSALTGKPLYIHHIRAQRSRPGLRPQHLAAVRAIAKLTGAKVSGDTLNSPELTLTPAKLRSGRFRFDIPTAGALTLLLQTVYLPLSLATGAAEVTLTGGTHVPWSPIFHYLDDQWLPTLSACGFRADLTLIKAGFYPRGGGKVQVRILPPKDLRPFVGLVRGPLAQIRGVSGVANLSDEIAQRQKHQALRRLSPLCRDTKIKTLRLPSPGKGTFIQLSAHFSDSGRACYSALGAQGKPAEQVADEAVDQLLSFLATDGYIDQYLADQILLPLLTIDGASTFSTSQVTPHLMTNAQVINQFLPGRVRIDGSPNEPGRVHISGGLLS
jgi:RNA 3'-terminal phosphate cyclase (ATP)